MWISKLMRNIAKFSSAKEIQAPKKYSQSVCKARAFMPLYNMVPYLPGLNFVAPNVTIVGNVFIGNLVSIWHNTVIRGDINEIRIHKNVYIGDNCVLHTAGSLPSGLPAFLQIQTHNVIQSGCTLYSCMIKSKAFIGANSVILQGAIIGEGAIIAPNSVVPPGRVIPPGQTWGGNPIKFIQYAPYQAGYLSQYLAKQKFSCGNSYKEQFLPYNNAYLYNKNPPPQWQGHYKQSLGNCQFLNQSYSGDYPTV